MPLNKPLPEDLSEFSDIHAIIKRGDTVPPEDAVEALEQLAFAYFQESTDNNWTELLNTTTPPILYAMMVCLFASIHERFRVITGWEESPPFVGQAQAGHIAGLCQAQSVTNLSATPAEREAAQIEFLTETRASIEAEYTRFILSLGEFRRSLARQDGSHRPIEIIVTPDAAVLYASVYGRAIDTVNAPPRGIRFLLAFKDAKNSILPKKDFEVNFGFPWHEAVTELCAWLEVADEERIIHDFAAEGTLNLANEIFVDVRADE